MAKVRLDTLLAQRGLFASRARAAASVMAGEVRLGGSDGDRAAKPGQLVAEDVELAVDERPRFVSRGGIKLANALQATGIDVSGRRCLDVGASTGGFTDCLLQGGAAHVVALDVAYGELDWSLRTDDRVTVIERTNARYARRRRPALRPRSRGRRPLLHLPDQGAARRARLLRGAASTRWRWSSRSSRSGASGRQGRRRALARGAPRGARRGGRRSPARTVPRCSASRPRACPGPKGNQETFVWLAEGGRETARADLDALARVVEP